MLPAAPPDRVRYALLTYTTRNVGDDIQSLAARRFLPRVDAYVDREALDTFKAPEGLEHRVVLNGWFMHRPDRWPPSEHLTPLLLSMHLSPQSSPDDGLGLVPVETLLAGENLAWLRRVGPVGARDLRTLDLLREGGVEAWFSGCLTLTLPSRDPDEAGDEVVLCDVPASVEKACRGLTRAPLTIVTHVDERPATAQERLARAEALLATYRRARCVVTSRLHAALPCLALGVPVLLLREDPEPARLEGLESLVRHARPKTWFEGRLAFDLDDPPPNPDHHLRLVAGLTTAVQRFVAEGRAGVSLDCDRRAVASTWAEVAALRAEARALREENARLRRRLERRPGRLFERWLGR